jgi:phosphate/sulfate permease
MRSKSELKTSERIALMKMLHSIKHHSVWILAPLVGMLTAACSTTTTQSFNVNKNAQVEAAYTATDADFSKYDRLFAQDMGIFFPTNAAPSVEDQMRTRQIFRTAFIAQLSGYQIVREAAPGALEVQATLIDYRNATGADVPGVRRELRDIARPGALMFLMEMKDPDTGQVLARAADSASAPAFSTSPGTATDWTAVEAAAAKLS